MFSALCCNSAGLYSQVASGKTTLDIEKILQDSRVLPCPQDLRYAVFAVGASQSATETIRRELPALRKSCIVKVLGPLRFELGLPNSVTAVISFHECYPEVTYMSILLITVITHPQKCAALNCVRLYWSLTLGLVRVWLVVGALHQSKSDT